MAQEIHVHEYPNGLVLLAERMDWVESAAVSVILPAGCTHDPSNQLGLANFTCEMAQRGCGSRNSRQVIQALDMLGADRGATVTPAHTNFAAAVLSENLGDTLALYADIVRRPHLPEDQVEDARQVCFHELHSLEDDLATRALQSVRRMTYGHPWGRRAAGETDHVQSVTHSDINDYVKNRYVPNGTLISVAGKIDWTQLVDQVAASFGDWETGSDGKPVDEPPVGGYQHIPHESEQTQIAVAYDSVPYRHEDYFQARGAVGVLSDGMSSRLFTQLREVRGLCYTVFATHHSLPHTARILSYVGTSAARAQESLDVLLDEIRKMQQGINENELARLKARVRSALIMQQEMSSSRAAAIAGDWFHLGRVRTMDEISTHIEDLTCESVNAYLADSSPSEFTIVSLGSSPLEVNVAVS